MTKNEELGFLVVSVGDSLRGQGLDRERGRGNRAELEIPVEQNLSTLKAGA